MTTPTVEETLYKMNGTFLREGDSGRALWKIADQLEELNRNIKTANEINLRNEL